MRTFMRKYTEIIDRICYYVSYLSMALIVLMMFLVGSDIILSLALNQRITGTYEVCQMMLSVFVFSSWAYTQTVHGHIHVVMFVGKMPQKLRFVCYGLTSLISFGTLVIASYAVYQQIFVKYAAHEITGNLRIPHWPFYVIELVAFILFAIVLLRDAIKAIAAIFDKEFAEDVQSSWV